MNETINLTPLKAWIGKTETVQDYLTESLIDRFRATLDPHLWACDVPLGLHWCLALPTVPTNDLSEDGHTKKGGFLPPVPLPSLMWAGGELVHHHSLIVNTPVTRVSKVFDIVAKQGKSGNLVFITVESEFYSGNKLCITDRQNLVFRGLSTLGKPVPPKASETGTGSLEYSIIPNPVLLFRYSALTFNSHRIHYDGDYAQNSEGYAGLVMHGPLQATLLLNQAAKSEDMTPKRFSFRGVAPVTLGNSIEIHRKDGAVWCQNADGIKSFVAKFSGT